jgi:hypothetical protein
MEHIESPKSFAESLMEDVTKKMEEDVRKMVDDYFCRTHKIIMERYGSKNEANANK